MSAIRQPQTFIVVEQFTPECSMELQSPSARAKTASAGASSYLDSEAMLGFVRELS
jgi:hypothetical protein